VNGSRPTVGALLSGLLAPKVLLGWFGTPVVTRAAGAGPPAAVAGVAGVPAAAAGAPPGVAEAVPTASAPAAGAPPPDAPPGETDGLAATGPD
jgi:hypothetical protein